MGFVVLCSRKTGSNEHFDRPHPHFTEVTNDPKENPYHMKHRFTSLSLLAALTVVSCVATTFAQEAKDTMPARPMYATLKPHLRNDIAPPATPLTTWNGSFVYRSHTYNY